jgi:hypothetical protein
MHAQGLNPPRYVRASGPLDPTVPDEGVAGGVVRGPERGVLQCFSCGSYGHSLRQVVFGPPVCESEQVFWSFCLRDSLTFFVLPFVHVTESLRGWYM